MLQKENENEDKHGNETLRTTRPPNNISPGTTNSNTLVLIKMTNNTTNENNTEINLNNTLLNTSLNKTKLTTDRTIK